jgi:hypothetical protein
MEEIPSSDTSVPIRTTRRCIPEDGIIHNYRCENLSCATAFLYFLAVNSCTFSCFVNHYLASCYSFSSRIPLLYFRIVCLHIFIPFISYSHFFTIFCAFNIFPSPSPSCIAPFFSVFYFSPFSFRLYLPVISSSFITSTSLPTPPMATLEPCRSPLVSTID